MKRYLVKEGMTCEARKVSYLKVDRNLMEWAINKAARLRENNDRDLKADHMMKLQEQFSELIEQLTLADFSENFVSKNSQWG